ncbi:response regulator SirA [Asaia sp. W19]|uniref:sulfurtransferase TusA family protein n=1 Tax=unclassified Asaia TaxID=2685023 RepID=UPI000F8E7089|nr:sulfurtransferase TusA family protein [Asaia sp. W19]RUT25007.1 response regulator SirA [Asaia sp. W19]
MTVKIVDITQQICPMTTVHVRLALDQASKGDELEILLKSEETLRNVRVLLNTLGETPFETHPHDEDETRYRITLVKS